MEASHGAHQSLVPQKHTQSNYALAGTSAECALIHGNPKHRALPLSVRNNYRSWTGVTSRTPLALQTGRYPLRDHGAFASPVLEDTLGVDSLQRGTLQISWGAGGIRPPSVSDGISVESPCPLRASSLASPPGSGDGQVMRAATRRQGSGGSLRELPRMGMCALDTVSSTAR